MEQKQKTLQTIHNFMKKLPWRQITGIACILLVGLLFWLDREQESLSDKMLRLHVLANSDSQEDQDLKLLVRDRVLETVDPWVSGDGSSSQAANTLRDRLPELQMEAQRAVWDEGYSYPVKVELETTWFPTRQYDDFALPAGNYESLRVIIGEGEGQNWWCVVFPPLCTATSTEKVSATAADAGLTDQEVFLILEDSEEYVIKFKAIEIWESVKHLFD